MGTERTAVTVIGLGQMGSALAAALLDRGHPITVWNRSAEKAQSLVARGARQAATSEEAVAASPLIIVCVLDYDALHATLDPAAGSLAGKSLVNLTSGSPEQAQEAAAWARSHAADYLDGAILTTPPGVGSPEMMFLYSGSPTVLDAHRPVLEALGDPLHLGAEPGLASLYDAALLGLMWSTMTGWLHGTALVGAERIEATAFTPVAVRWLSAVTGFMTTYATQVDAGHYPGDDATVDVQIATIDHLLHAAAARGLDNALPELLKATMERTRDAGHGSSSYASVIEVLRKGAGERAGSA
ncbi:NAD(P)-binding domain-containing protein [Streptomyces sp. JL1001]|uniref:NAD(P)-binding domain-containing protein n=1 Tax=Streptomyces sp. JL1001 TaxID=3078227 RepID=A0AAU8KGU7_9ACTN|nr:NAD(P)-binding domain-containing protein [Streptomyces sp. Termitarium-T10T-6]SCE59573.1 3-hydroxyisobutyrate dehydrogenase [Streptomyces sp. Termitarium-T10T-6]